MSTVRFRFSARSAEGALAPTSPGWLDVAYDWDGTPVSVAPPCADLLRRLAVNDEEAVGSIFGAALDDDSLSELGDKTRALVRIAALIASEAAGASYQWAIGNALSAGVVEDEVVGVLLSVAPLVGVARVAAAAPELGLALGYDFDTPDG